MAQFKLLMIALLFAGTAADARRVAIIIANEAYASEARLANPLRDARAIATALGPQGARFDEVRLLTNLDQKGLKRAIIGIASTAAGADTLLVYFSGHGIRDPYRRNFLLPVDANINKEEDIPVEGVDAQEVLDAVREARPKAGLIVLDACRNNPFQDRLGKKGTNKGLARMDLDGVKGILVAYAAEGGEQADDGKPGAGSPFASAFAHLIATPGTPLLAVLDKVGDEVVATTNGRQSPTRDGNLRADYVLVPGNTVPVVEPVVLRADVERELWDMCKTGTTPAPCSAYLQRHGSGVYAELARLRLDALAPPPATVDPPNLAKSRRALAAIAPELSGSTLTTELYNRFKAAGGSAGGLEALAKAGDLNAMTMLGTMLTVGFDGYPPDLPAMVGWLTTPAQRGIARAQNNLGASFLKGEGTTANKTEAVRLYGLAANQGFAPAQANLGILYRTGDSVPQNKVEAVRLFRLAADQGNAQGRYNLAMMHQKGDGIPENKAEAIRLYRLAADQGDEGAQFSLAVMHLTGDGLPMNKVEAARLFKLLADKGDPEAQTNLAALYQQGQGVPQDMVEAVRFYRLAASKGEPFGQSNLGAMYEQGLGGLAKDQDQAVAWYRKGAAQGNAYAVAALKRLGISP